MSTAHEIPMQHLLQHRAWVRRLARHLVADEARADDLEQQTWLAALQKPPTGDTPKAWLGTVMRNLAARMRRGEVRVDRRERAAARPERLPPAGDVVAEAELHKRVVQAVLDLEPPYRETVLHRHYEGLPPREIAARMGVSVETVRSRVRRGMEQIRARFDREHGGDGHTWRLTLLPLAAGPATGLSATTAKTAAGKSGGAILTGALLMAAKSKVTIAAIVLLLLAGGLWIATSATEPNAPEAPPVIVGEGDADPATLNTKGTAKKALETEAPPAREPQAPPPALADGDCAIRVVRAQDGRDVSVRKATVRVVGASKVHAELETDAHGRALLPEELIGSKQTVWVEGPEGVLARRDLQLAEGETLVRLAQARRAELRFVDAAGKALSPAEVKRRYEEAGLDPRVTWISSAALDDKERMLVNMFGEKGGLQTQSTLLFEGEHMVLAGAPSEGAWRLLVDRPGAGPDISNVMDLSSEEPLIVTLPLPDTASVGVRVRLLTHEDGLPIAGASVVPYFELGDDQAFLPGAARRTDAAGEVVLPKFDTRGRKYQRAPVWWLTTPTHATRVYGWDLDKAKVGAVMERKAWRNAAVEGRAWTRKGEPAVGARVMWFGKGYRRDTTVRADGTYRLDAIPYSPAKGTQIFLLEALSMEGIQLGEAVLKPGETTQYDIGKPADPAGTGRIEVTLTAGGRPLEGLFVMAGQDKRGGEKHVGRTKADGTFTLEGLETGGYRMMWALGDPRANDDYGGRSTFDVVVMPGETVELVFDLPGGVLDVVVLDAATGKPVPGAVAFAQASEKDYAKDRFERFDLKLGWAERTSPKGEARLRALPLATPLTLRYGAQGYQDGEKTNVRAGGLEAPPRIEVKLTKKP